MSVIQSIPENARPRIPVARFESDPLAAGQYSFNNAANLNQNFLQLRGQSVYLIDRISFSCNIPEGVWLESIQGTTADFPSIRLRKETSEVDNMFMEPIRTLNYWDYGETLLFFRPRADTEFLQISMRGIVDQVSGTVGFATLICQVSMVIYEIGYTDWTRYFEGKNVRFEEIG